MRRLDDCPRMAGERGSAVVRDPKTQMELVVTGAELASYLLDDDRTWGPGRRPDGVLIGEEPGQGWVVFVELKGRASLDSDPYEQLIEGVGHFADVAGTHGAEHHALWRTDEDLPRARRGRRDVELRLGPTHRIAGVLATSRGGTRIAPRTIEAAGKRVVLVTHQRHGVAGRSEVSWSDLLRALGER
ncbi:MAG: hypothetical protein IT378_20240 [Sandaracinaceae bacterium]|nr:hypothetical protein [Sandaracinaceae bacterium]